MNHRLVLRQGPPLRVDARALTPALLGALSADEVRRLRLPHGREGVMLAELFDVRPGRDDGQHALVLEGDLSRFDAIGAGLAEGTMEVHGPVGDAAGLGMSGGRLLIRGDARDLAGCAMRGGWLEVDGSIGDLGASALPGERDGMRGGTLVVRGAAGHRLADHMRRGTVVVFGDAGDFVASRMVAGTLALAGRCGVHAGFGMRRGTVLFAGPAPEPAASFVPVNSDAPVFWQLLARDLARFGGPFDGLSKRRVDRWAGDLAVLGHGELLIPH
ncbi:formylmethanofuran dehydrogenase subunit C [Piscinibacter sp. XHJ-5]|uniref:formylmethanofuran dehydrogenase subunit C n=1 Tax=Piscinibacter sp. XHJ-5 TaxID=3037797 RepID=UPI002452C253|nr:formylmethanofuran dehydrogenase subunit C [Piscinibacter sp. XHJ-5]